MLVYTSLLFISNALHAFYKQRFIYSILFILLSISSLLFYSLPSIYTNLFDKFAILLVVSYGAFLLYFKTPFKQFVISLTFLCTIILFFFGFLTQSFCFGPHGNHYHAALHFISSLGHHLILIWHLSLLATACRDNLIYYYYNAHAEIKEIQVQKVQEI